MCRVFGFRSATESSVHHSLVRARNALTVQSKQHPDGWGIACYVGDRPELTRGTGAAFVEGSFGRTARMVSSHTVVAHVRKASCGAVRRANSHPFVRGRWVFAHNGDVARWEAVRGAVEAEIDPALLGTLEGETDSERCFLLFLTLLKGRGVDLEGADLPFDIVASALTDTVARLRALADPGAPKPSVLTFVVSNGPVLAAIHSGNTLWYSTHKVRCRERDRCPLLDAVCERPARAGEPVRHLLVASEPLSTENVWYAVPDGAVVGVDGAMRLCTLGARRAAEPAPVEGLGI
ncbi:MAG: class II glutamine amidotransferase [Deltaproteobacteria bacterium]|nr:MAG: class II glutamine amidotransferase [Deltaproteobacteria bacterium]